MSLFLVKVVRNKFVKTWSDEYSFPLIYFNRVTSQVDAEFPTLRAFNRLNLKDYKDNSILKKQY